MIKVVILITFLLINLYAQEINNKRVMQISGKIDPRLYVYFVSEYISTNLEKEGCYYRNYFASNPGIRASRVYTSVDVTEKNYMIKIPIDYNLAFIGDRKNCKYKYVDTVIIMKRRNTEKIIGAAASSYTILSNSNKSNHVLQLTNGGGKLVSKMAWRMFT